jgi:hypothetical protein
MVETPLHPHARHTGGKLIGEVQFKLDTSELTHGLDVMAGSFRDAAIRMALLSMQLHQPLSLCVVSGV